jgi:hypothetical protein
MAASALVVVAGSMVAATGVSHADDNSYLRVTLHWNINMTDVGEGTCAQASSQVAMIAPENTTDDKIEMVAPKWKEKCHEAFSHVSSTARRLDDGSVEVHTILAALKDNIVWDEQGATITVAPDSGTKSADIKLASSGSATAFGNFFVGVTSLAENEAVSFERTMQIDHEGIDGNATVKLYRTGQWVFSGHMHNTNFAAKNVGLQCGLEYKFNKFLYFGVTGDLNGSLGAIGADKSFDWSQNGTESEINTAWQDSNLKTGVALIECDMPVETDTGADVGAGFAIILKLFDAIF